MAVFRAFGYIVVRDPTRADSCIEARNHHDIGGGDTFGYGYGAEHLPLKMIPITVGILF